MRPRLAAVTGAFLAFAALSSACDSPQQVPPLDLQRGELAQTLGELEARLLQLTDVAYRIRETGTVTPDAASAADRLQAEVALLRSLSDELRRTGRSICLFPEPNTEVDLPRLKADAAALSSQAARLAEHGNTLADIGAAVDAAGLPADADVIASASTLFKNRAARLSATADVLIRRAQELRRSVGLVEH